MSTILNRRIFRRVFITGLAAVLGLVLSMCQQEVVDKPNTLSEVEQEAGWELLFDGESFDGWIGLGRDEIPEAHWTIEDGTIKKIPSGEIPVADDGQPLEGGDIMTVETYRNYELKLEWKISEGGNSGLKYNVSEEMSTSNEPIHAALGFEYQILDDDNHPDGEDPTHRTGALYDLIEPNDQKNLLPVGEWNESRLVFDGNHGEHWLNNRKVVEFDLDTEEFQTAFNESKYAPIEGFADKRSGHIVLQDHGDAVWYRNIKIKVLD